MIKRLKLDGPELLCWRSNNFYLHTYRIAMNPVSHSTLLSKANNCYYIQVDNALVITSGNEAAKTLRFESGKYLLDFFNQENCEKLTASFHEIKTDDQVLSVKTEIGLEKDEFEIDWNIAALTTQSATKTGFELLGVLSKEPLKKSPLEIDLSTTTASAPAEISAKNEKRVKAVVSKIKKILDSSLDMICVIDERGKFRSVSAASKKIIGYAPRELIGKSYVDFVYKEDVAKSKEATQNILKGVGITNFENRFIKKDGSLAYLVWSSRWEENDKRFYCIGRDATQKKAGEAALKASEEKYKILFYNHPVATWIYDVDTLLFLEVNDATLKQYGYSREEFLMMPLTAILSEQEADRYYNYHNHDEFFKQMHNGLWLHKKKNGQLFYCEITSTPIDYPGKQAKLVLAIDRTEQTIAEQELRKINEKYHFLSQAAFDAIWDWDLKSNQVDWNERAKEMFLVSDPSVLNMIDWWYNHLHDMDRERVITKLQKHIEQHIPNWEDEYMFKAGDDTYKYIYDRGYIIYNENNEPVRMIGAMQDLTERKSHENMLQKLNMSLERRAKELAESNEELERFAYVASHDLQEPLRMVTSFLQLIQKRYNDKLDSKGHQYIRYAVDGAERMKKLILDLLEYSRVNSSKVEFQQVDVNEIVQEVKKTYKSLLKETDGTVRAGEMPTIKANKTQILQLFQNLIGNAIKYRKDEPPVIDISVEEEKSFYKFKIADNGIGIQPKFYHKIFVIFQRLHNREEYSGTGIGLAICKKIVEKHGGKIWVTSEPGQGSTFYFNLPKSK